MIASPWLEVRYEDAVTDLETETRRALEFLSLPWDPKVLNYREGLKQKAVGSPTYEAVSQPLYTRAIGAGNIIKNSSNLSADPPAFD
jgi:hypothetical protein